MSDPLTVYTLPGHPDRTATLHALDSAQLPYTVIDLASDHDAAARLLETGTGTLPIVVAGAATWTGHQPDRIRAVTRARSRALENYTVPVDPMDLLQCDSCQ
jgi:glutaredoxin-like protein NrdH